MNRQKLSLAAIQDKLSRNEMKQIMAGLDEVSPPGGGGSGRCNCNSSDDCPTEKPVCYNCEAIGGGGPKVGYCDK
jgi:hypothetical protein